MKIAYIYPEKLPAKNARSISVLSTFEYLQHYNAKLYIENSNLSNIKKFYNLQHTSNIVNIDKKFIIRTNKIFNFNLVKQLKKDNIDIVYARHLKVASYLITKGFKVVFECHEVFHQTTQNKSNKHIQKLKQLESFVYTRSAGLTFINENLKKYFNTIFDLNNKQLVVHNGTEFNQKFYVKNFDNINEVYYIGNFLKWKGVGDLIKAIAKLDNIVLNIVGAGSNKNELISLTNKLNITNRVNFLGFLNKDQIYEILTKKSKITIIPNNSTIYSEFSTPIKLYEYMATNNVIIASNLSPIRELIDNKNGFLFESGNIEDLANTITTVLNMNNDNLQKIADNAFNKSKEFTWKKRADNICKFLKSL
jgi:glycosyltransferase involved in cell wall biosynthesis